MFGAALAAQALFPVPQRNAARRAARRLGIGVERIVRTAGAREEPVVV
jgi:hypothetical protein